MLLDLWLRICCRAPVQAVHISFHSQTCFIYMQEKNKFYYVGVLVRFLKLEIQLNVYFKNPVYLIQ